MPSGTASISTTADYPPAKTPYVRPSLEIGHVIKACEPSCLTRYAAPVAKHFHDDALLRWILSTTMVYCFLDVAPEVILYIFSFLDLPDLASISQVSPVFEQLASDPALHKNRIRIVAPSRVNHSLFGQSPQGIALRPTVGDLVHRGVLRGLNIERRWRMGLYLYSTISVRQYEAGLSLQRRRTTSVLSSFLRQRVSNPNALKSLHVSHVLPDIESSSPSVSRTLLPIMRQLKWSIQRDKLAKIVREGACIIAVVGAGGKSDAEGFGRWLESKGRGLIKDDLDERVRLAICPGVKKIVGHYEALGGLTN